MATELTFDEKELCRFGGYAVADLNLARAIATHVVQVYGQDSEKELEQIRRGGIWNDHPAVQAALSAIRITKRRAIVR